VRGAIPLVGGDRMAGQPPPQRPGRDRVFALNNRPWHRLDRPAGTPNSTPHRGIPKEASAAVRSSSNRDGQIMKLAIGEILQGYRITRFLGRGGFSSVYLAQHEETGNKVALKVGNASGGGRQVTRLLEVTARRTPEGISPDELPAEAVFFEPQGVRIDLFD